MNSPGFTVDFIRYYNASPQSRPNGRWKYAVIEAYEDDSIGEATLSVRIVDG